MHFLRIESTQKSSNKRPATSTYSVREASQSKPFFSRCAMRPCGHTRPPHPHLAWVWLTWSFAFSTAFWLFCAAPGKAFDHFSHGWQGNDFLKETGKKNQSQRKIFGKSSFWNNSCIYLMCCYLFFFFSVWNFGNFPTQLSTTKKNGPVHEHLHLLLNGCFLFQANVQVLLGFSFGQSSPSPGAPRNLLLTKSSLLKLIER